MVAHDYLYIVTSFKISNDLNLRLPGETKLNLNFCHRTKELKMQMQLPASSCQKI